VTDLAALEPAPDAGTAASVVALPALPAAEPTDRYGVRQLTVTWLVGFADHTRTAYFRDLAHFLAWCQRLGIDPMRARGSDLDHYRATLEQPPTGGRRLSPATVHRRLSALSSWYRYLVANSDGVVSVNPAAAVRRPRVDRDASATVGLTTEQVRALLRAADEVASARLSHVPPATGIGDTIGRRHARVLAALRDRALLRLLADLGLRIGEALALDVNALSHNQGRRTVRYRGKGGTARERPLSAGVGQALDDYLAARARATNCPVDRLSGPLFATTGRDGGNGRLTEPAAFLLVRRVARYAGIPSADRLSPHSLRHAFATNARELGIPLEDVQDAMGHADARTTRRYDRGRHALHRDPALRLGELYDDRALAVEDVGDGSPRR
jgi:integrase/recombinase XerD